MTTTDGHAEPHDASAQLTGTGSHGRMPGCRLLLGGSWHPAPEPRCFVSPDYQRPTPYSPWGARAPSTRRTAPAESVPGRFARLIVPAVLNPPEEHSTPRPTTRSRAGRGVVRGRGQLGLLSVGRRPAQGRTGRDAERTRTVDPPCSADKDFSKVDGGHPHPVGCDSRTAPSRPGVEDCWAVRW